MRLAFLTLIAIVFLGPWTARAGVMELGAAYSLRTSRIDDQNYTNSESWTGSLAWYFMEMSAIELSYTNAVAEQSLQAPGESQLTYIQEFTMYGGDIVFTFAGHDSMIQPFVRGGAARLKKLFYRQASDGSIVKYGDAVDMVVPSYGGGLNLNVTQTFRIKVSYDRWESGSSADKAIWDSALKLGVSWLF